MNRKICWTLVLCMLLNGSLWAQKSKTLPNILLILVDDLGYHDVSYYDSSQVSTPNLDALCRSGMRLDRFYSNSPVCAPTRAALLSGRYPDAVGVPGLIRYHANNNWGYLNPSTILMPKVLKQVGYHTALVGKWNLGLESPNLPNEKGFDHFHGWLEDMMDDYWTHLRHNINFLRFNLSTIQAQGHASDLFSDWSIQYLQAQAKSQQPFFLYLAYNAPHFPVQAPEEAIKKVQGRFPGLSEKRAKLSALIAHLDENIGRVIQALKANGQYDNTIIIFSSDNGGHLPDLANNGPLRDGKQSMYEGGLRVPSFVLWPGRIRPGSHSNQSLASMDVFPTLLDLLKLPAVPGLDGRSFAQILLAKTDAMEPRDLYFVRREGGPAYGGMAYHALMQGDWKLLQNSPFQPYELYDLSKDPKEQNNLMPSESKRFQQMNAQLMRYIQAGAKVPWQKP